MNAKNRERIGQKTQKNKAEEKFNLGLLNDNGHEKIVKKRLDESGNN